DGKLRAHRADADGIDARHLAGADADGLAGARVDDGVRLGVLADRPGEDERLELLCGRLAAGDDFEVFAAKAMSIAGLDEQAARHTFEVQALRLSGNACTEDTQ